MSLRPAGNHCIVIVEIMNQERDLPMGDIDHLSVDDDRRAPSARKPAGSGNNGAGAGGGEPPRRKRAASSPPPRRSGGGFWIASTLILLVITLGMGAFMYQELSAVRAQLDTRISESSEQLGSLASQLSAADESFSQSAGQVQDTLKLHMDEIRKLWDVSNRRNRGWIEDNQKAIKALQASQTEAGNSLAALRRETATVRSEAEAAKKTVEELRASQQQHTVARNQMQTQLDLAHESLKQLESRAAAQQRTLEEIRRVLPQLQALASAQGQGGGVAARLNDIEAAIAAFDDYRRQVNTRLDAIQGR